jgi:hypothetical protein
MALSNEKVLESLHDLPVSRNSIFSLKYLLIDFDKSGNILTPMKQLPASHEER